MTFHQNWVNVEIKQVLSDREREAVMKSSVMALMECILDGATTHKKWISFNVLECPQNAML